MNLQPTTIRIELRRRIWRVTVDDRFYGDYRSERHAVNSAEAAASTLRARGRIAHIMPPVKVEPK